MVISGASHKFVWVRCYGVPLPFWNRDCFTKVLGELSTSASLMSIDDSTLSWEVLEYARLRVRIVNNGNVKMARRMKINNHICSIIVEEEPLGFSGGGCIVSLSCGDSSDSVSSSETYVEETTLSVRSGVKKTRLRDDEEWWSDGDDGGGEEM